MDESTADWPSPTAPNNKRSFLTFLARAQRTSGLVFSSFLLVHAIPPTIVAITGKEHSGNAFMLVSRPHTLNPFSTEQTCLTLPISYTLVQLLRVAYQHPVIEPVLIYLPLSIHILASAVRRVMYPRSHPAKLNSHSITGFLLTPLALLHILVHRIVPASAKPPISSLSPSELDLSYVGHAVATWPYVSTVTYGALVALGVWHAVGGLAIVSRRSGWAKAKPVTVDAAEEEESGPVVVKATKRASSLVSWRAGLTSLATAVTGVALFRLTQDVFVTKAMAGRIEYVHRRVAGLIYR